MKKRFDGFDLIDDGYKDLFIFRREGILLVSMAKFKEDKKAFRVATNHLDGRLIAELMSVFSSLPQYGGLKAIILTSSHLVGFSRGAKIEVLQGSTTSACRLFITEAQKLLTSCPSTQRRKQDGPDCIPSQCRL